MTQEELELLKELQPVIRKHMGSWEIGDRFAYPVNGYPTKLVDSRNIEDVISNTSNMTLILIPDAISRDSERPQRGLWGMIDWGVYNVSIDSDGEIRAKIGTWEPYRALLEILKFQTEQNGKGSGLGERIKVVKND